MATWSGFKCTQLPSPELALTNKIYVSGEDYSAFKSAVSASKVPGNHLKIKDFVFAFAEHAAVTKGVIAFNRQHRSFALIGLIDQLEVSAFVVPATNTRVFLSSVLFEVDYLNSSSKSKGDEFKGEELEEAIKKHFLDQFFTVGQSAVILVRGNKNLTVKVKDCYVVDMVAFARGDSAGDPLKANRGLLTANTELHFEKAEGAAFRIAGTIGAAVPLFRPNFNIQNMGIGGLDKQFNEIFRLAFSLRVFPPGMSEKIGLPHAKGLLLYGPPGTGKTLMARQIGKMLNGKEPLVVNGPEVLSKYVGEAEANIRKLFEPAEIEYREKGEQSDLHIIIFDELDALFKQRGSRNDGTGVNDTVVNQILTKMDGVEALNNILVIGMTNRIDMLDKALMRPGRFEILLEVGLPDEKGRADILKIHTTKLAANKYLSADVDLLNIATRTKNFTGAEILGLVKSATTYALNREIDISDGIKAKSNDILVTMADFNTALATVRPSFGTDTNELAGCLRNGIISFGPSVDELLREGSLWVQQVRSSSRTPLISLLVEGPNGSGKTALAAKLASESGFPFVKMISPETLVGCSETEKCNRITTVFNDSYKSPLSCIVVDEIERILDYVRIGPRFSNLLLQTLAVLLKKEPPQDPPHHRGLVIIATTSNKQLLEDMEISDLFTENLQVPLISTVEEFRNVLDILQPFKNEADIERACAQFKSPVAIKRLSTACEMAKQTENGAERFLRWLKSANRTTV